jgi:mannosyltransferase
MTFGAIAVVSSLALVTSLGKSIWTDEAVSLYSAHLSWSALWQQSHVVDRVFLPYYALLHLWLLINGSIEWARVLSLLAYALSVFFVGRLAYRLAGFWGGVAAAVLCATNPLMVQEALDARPYALTALFATLSVTFLLRWLDGGSTRQFWWFTVAAIAELAMQQFSVLAPLAALAVVILLRPATVRDRWRSVVLPVGVLLVVSVGFVAITIGQRAQVGWIHALTGAYLLNALNGPAASSSFSGRVAYTLVVIVLLVTAVVVLLISRSRLHADVSRTDVDRFAVLVAWAALPTVALIVVSLVKPIYLSRYVTASAPGLALAVALLVMKAYEVRPERLRATALVVRTSLCVLTVVLVLEAAVASTYQAEQVAQASRSLEEQVGTTGVAAYTNPLIAQDFAIYAPTRHWPFLQQRNLMFWKLDLRTSASTFTSAPTNVWVVLSTDSGRFIKLLKSHGYSRVGEEKFSGFISVSIEHLRR